MLVAMMLPTCNFETKENVTANFDSLKNANVVLKTKAEISEIKANFYKGKCDSLKTAKSVILRRYAEKKEVIHDTAFVEIVNYCDSLNLINDKIIEFQDTVIARISSSNSDLKLLVLNFEKQISISENKLKEIEKNHKKEIRRQKIKTFLIGALGASAVITTVYLAK